jgi:hypothetical protein
MAVFIKGMAGSCNKKVSQQKTASDADGRSDAGMAMRRRTIYQIDATGFSANQWPQRKSARLHVSG